MPRHPKKQPSESSQDIVDESAYIPVLNNSKAEVRKRQDHLQFLVDRLADHKSTIKIEVIRYLDEKYHTGDFVHVHSHSSSDKPMPCKIIGFYQLSQQFETIPIVELQLCLIKDDFAPFPKIKELFSDRELFPTNRRVCQYVTTIQEKIQVVDEDQFMSSQQTNNRLYFTRAGFDCYFKTFQPPISKWKRICVCNVIPRPETMNPKMILCSECQDIFHRSCVGIKTRKFVCPNCDLRKEKDPKEDLQIIEEYNEYNFEDVS